MQDMSFPRVQFSIFFSGWACACPRTQVYNSCIRADSTLVFAVTLVLNVQLQKTPHLDKMNDYTEKQWSKIYIILNKNRSLNTKENIQNKTKAAVKRAIKKRATCFATLLQTKLNSDVARFTTYVRPCLAIKEIRLQGLFSWVVKRATSLFNSFCSHVAKQIARFLLPVLPFLR